MARVQLAVNTTRQDYSTKVSLLTFSNTIRLFCFFQFCIAMECRGSIYIKDLGGKREGKVGRTKLRKHQFISSGCLTPSSVTFVIGIYGITARILY